MKGRGESGEMLEGQAGGRGEEIGWEPAWPYETVAASHSLNLSVCEFKMN